MENKKFVFANRNNWDNLITRIIGRFNIFAPFLINDDLHYLPATQETAGNIAYNLNRPIQPTKIFFFTPSKKVTGENLSKEIEKRDIILGVSACDLMAFKVLDKLFLEGDFIEPFYSAKKANSIIISADCYAPKEVCFCSVVGNKPFPEDGFDLNISCLTGGFLVEIGTQKGNDFTEQYKLYFQPADEDKLKERTQKRNAAINRLKYINMDFSYKDSLQNIVKNNYGLVEAWQEVSKNCVACGACNFVCPSCNCFLLVDEKVKDALMKLRMWDSCQFSGFSRVAGGANPRKYIWQKLRNRLSCKFNYKKENFGLYSCTGCGRCRESCTAKIDIREVLRDVESVSANRI